MTANAILDLQKIRRFIETISGRLSGRSTASIPLGGHPHHAVGIAFGVRDGECGIHMRGYSHNRCHFASRTGLMDYQAKE
jgi:hypothetical protein